MSSVSQSDWHAPRLGCGTIPPADRASRKGDDLKRARIQNGTVVFNKRFRTWNYLWFEEGRRRSKLIGTIEEYKTREAALRASERLRQSVHELRPHDLPTVRALVNEFRSEKMPERFSTRVGYDAWFNNHILPRWGQGNITPVQPRPVELWLDPADLPQKQSAHPWPAEGSWGVFDVEGCAE